MPALYYEYLSAQQPLCHCAKLGHNRSLSILQLRQDIEGIVQDNKTNPDKQYYLLDESRFSFFRFDIHFQTQEKVTIHDIQQIKERKLKEINKLHGATGELLQTFIDTIFVDNQEKERLIGHQGDIFFRLYFIFLRTKTLHMYNRFFGDIHNHPEIQLLPQSLQTIFFLRKQLRKDNFLLLYIHENIVKAIKIQNGFYEQGEIINLGISAIKKMYKENGISNYRYQTADEIQSNPIAKQLISESLEFYCETLCRRGDEKNLLGTDIIVISPLVKHPFFIETFNKIYNQSHAGFIVPFHSSNDLDTMHMQREPQDIDLLVAINRIGELKQLLQNQ